VTDSKGWVHTTHLSAGARNNNNHTISPHTHYSNSESRNIASSLNLPYRGEGTKESRKDEEMMVRRDEERKA
jgi:hypothetical protein